MSAGGIWRVGPGQTLVHPSGAKVRKSPDGHFVPCGKDGTPDLFAGVLRYTKIEAMRIALGEKAKAA